MGLSEAEANQESPMATPPQGRLLSLQRRLKTSASCVSKRTLCGLVSGCTSPADVMVTSSALQKAVAIVPLVTFRFSSRRRKIRHQRLMRHLVTHPSVPSSRTSRQRLCAWTKLSTDAPFALLLAASRCFETSE